MRTSTSIACHLSMTLLPHSRLQVARSGTEAKELWCTHVARQTAQAEKTSEHVGVWQYMSLLIFEPPVLQRTMADIQGCQALGCLSPKE